MVWAGMAFPPLDIGMFGVLADAVGVGYLDALSFVGVGGCVPPYTWMLQGQLICPPSLCFSLGDSFWGSDQSWSRH